MEHRDVCELPEGWWSAGTFWSLSSNDKNTWALSQEDIRRMERCHAYLAERASGGDTLYGINTGFGDLATTRVDDLKGLQGTS